MVLLQLRSDSVFGYETYSMYREAVANSAEDSSTTRRLLRGGSSNDGYLAPALNLLLPSESLR